MFRFGHGFWMGFWAPLQALRLILTSPRLLSLVAVPLGVNIGLYLIFFGYGVQALHQQISIFQAHYATALPGWLLSISVVSLKFLGWALIALTAAFSFTFVSGIISAPFNDSLSKATYKIRLTQIGRATPSHPNAFGVKSIVKLELKRILILALGAVLATLLGLIPLMQLPALGIGALLVSFEYFGYPISHRSPRLAPVALFTLRHPAVSLGFGSFLLLMMALPFASLVYIPLAVVAGTTLYVDLCSPKGA